ncbi:MAG: HEAT repeat domain-containing protein, partial [Thermoanaerobaculia bacterium]
GSFFAGHQIRTPEATPSHLAPAVASHQFDLADNVVIPSSQLRPDIQGRPDIQNIKFDQNNSTGNVSVSFDVTSHVTVNGRPDDKSLVNLLSYVLQNRDYHARSNAIQWVRETSQQSGRTDPELVSALANVLTSDSHEGVRLKAVEALKSMPSPLAPDARDALIQALKNDPNPAVRIKAVEALANFAREGGTLDNAAVDTLRQKAAQNDENLYVRVKAAEALSQINL